MVHVGAVDPRVLATAFAADPAALGDQLEAEGVPVSPVILPQLRPDSHASIVRAYVLDSANGAPTKNEGRDLESPQERCAQTLGEARPAAAEKDASPGLQFRGRQLLTPGAECDPASLPRPAVLIEYAGQIRVGKQRSRYAFSSLWLLWRFDAEASRWVEVVRATANDATWSLDFAPIAKRLLDDGQSDRAAQNAQSLSERVLGVLAAELAEMTKEVRCHVLAALDQFVAAEIVRTARPLTLHAVSVGDRRWYPRLGIHDGAGPGELRV